MIIAKLQYKCRQCGAIEENPCTSEVNAQITLISLVRKIDISRLKLIGLTPKMKEIHVCNHNDRGVADLIGYKVYDE